MTPGFCGLKNGAAPANSPMTDTNADLIGFTFPVDSGGHGTVTRTAPWNPAYVEVDTDAGPTARVAAQVRRSKELSA